jgi:hypothetical protein
MVVGDRYLVRYRSGTQRLDRTAVMVYLGQDADTLQFSARPVAGTQRLPRSWIRSVEPVPANTPAHINRIVPREARRFVVRRLEGYRKGERRWVVWDTVRSGWADEARTTRRDAQDICDELNAATAAAPRDQVPE